MRELILQLIAVHLELEAYVCMDLQDVNEIAHILWVRKAVRNTRALVLTAGSQPTFGIQSLIRDPEILRQRYGLEVVKLPFTSIFNTWMRSQTKKQDQLQKRSSMVLQIPR